MIVAEWGDINIVVFQLNTHLFGVTAKWLDILPSFNRVLYAITWYLFSRYTSSRWWLISILYEIKFSIEVMNMNIYEFFMFIGIFIIVEFKKLGNQV